MIGCESIGFISLIMVFFFYLFGVLGVFLFGTSLYLYLYFYLHFYLYFYLYM